MRSDERSREEGRRREPRRDKAAAVRWLRAHPDVLLALAAAAINVIVATFAARHQHPDRTLDLGGYVLLLAGPAFLAVRRRWPSAVLAGVFVAPFAYLWLGYLQGPVWLPLIVAFGGAVLMGKRVAAYTALVAGFVSATWISSAGWAPHNGQAVVSRIMVKLRPGVDVAAAETAIKAATNGYGEPRVQDRAEYRSSSTSGVNTFLGLIYVMLALAIIIALMGISNTLSLSIHERTRELGLLRAVGQTRKQTRAISAE